MPSIFWKQGTSNYSCLASAAARQSTSRTLHEKSRTGEFDLEGIWQKPDEEVIRELSALKGIGVWTAEMILLFCMQRPDVFSYDDLAIQRGLRMVYHQP